MTDIRCNAPSSARLVTFDFLGDVFAGLARAIGAGFGVLLTWQARVSERHRLAGLDQRLLSDAGLSDAEVAQEVRKPFWRA